MLHLALLDRVRFLGFCLDTAPSGREAVVLVLFGCWCKASSSLAVVTSVSSLWNHTSKCIYFPNNPLFQIKYNHPKKLVDSRCCDTKIILQYFIIQTILQPTLLLEPWPPVLAAAAASALLCDDEPSEKTLHHLHSPHCSSDSMPHCLVPQSVRHYQDSCLHLHPSTDCMMSPCCTDNLNRVKGKAKLLYLYIKKCVTLMRAVKP